MWKGLSLEGEIVRYSSVSRSPTLGRNEKVEQHIRKKTRKPNALRFWVEGGVILLYGFTQFSLFEISPVSPSDSPNTINSVNFIQCSYVIFIDVAKNYWRE